VKKSDTVLSTLLLVLVFLCSVLHVAAALSLYVSVWIAREPAQNGETVLISGRVTDDSGSAVPNAQVSIQINDPIGTSVHIALVYSGLDGAYSDRFPLLSGSPSGNYTIYITVSKPGYNDASEMFLFVNSARDFSISVSHSSISVAQGESISLTVTLSSTSEFDSPVSLILTGAPAGVSHIFVPNPIVPAGSANLTIHTLASTPPGSYNLTIAASGGGKTHLASAILVVTEKGYSSSSTAIGIAIVVFAVAVSIGALWMRRHFISKLPEERSAEVQALLAQLEAKGDRDYLATARALTRLEELRATERIDEETYQKLKREYEKRLGEISEREGRGSDG
jgi:hypothetical protein